MCVTVCETMHNCVHACVRPCAILCMHHVFKTMHNCVWWSCPTSAVLMTMSTPFIDLAHYQLIWFVSKLFYLTIRTVHLKFGKKNDKWIGLTKTNKKTELDKSSASREQINRTKLIMKYIYNQATYMYTMYIHTHTCTISLNLNAKDSDWSYLQVCSQTIFFL